MKAYALDLRERVVKFIHGGGSKAEAARLSVAVFPAYSPDLSISGSLSRPASAKTWPTPPTPSFLSPICPDVIVSFYNYSGGVFFSNGVEVKWD